MKVAGAAKNPGDEAYTLTAKPGAGIEIVGTDPAGVFYGIQIAPRTGATRRAIARQASRSRSPRSKSPMPRVSATADLHLDVARNFQSVETVKKLLDLMAFYKLNRFHWHLTDDEGWRIEIKSLPELTTVGGRRGHTATETDSSDSVLRLGTVSRSEQSAGSGYYTQDEFIDILRYAHARHITVIPEIDVPGHSRAAIKAMAARAQCESRRRSRFPA